MRFNKDEAYSSDQIGGILLYKLPNGQFFGKGNTFTGENGRSREEYYMRFGPPAQRLLQDADKTGQGGLPITSQCLLAGGIFEGEFPTRSEKLQKRFYCDKLVDGDELSPTYTYRHRPEGVVKDAKWSNGVIIEVQKPVKEKWEIHFGGHFLTSVEITENDEVRGFGLVEPTVNSLITKVLNGESQKLVLRSFGLPGLTATQKRPDDFPLALILHTVLNQVYMEHNTKGPLHPALRTEPTFDPYLKGMFPPWVFKAKAHTIETVQIEVETVEI